MPVEFDSAAGKSKRLSGHFSDIALQLNIHFLDAGEFITPSITDPIHWDASAHQILGTAVAGIVRAIRGKFKDG